MSNQSDLPYVIGPDGNPQRSNPVFNVNLFRFTDKSGTLANTNPFTLFEEETHTGVSNVVSRVISNLSETDSIWINMSGGVAGIRAPGSFEIKPGDTWTIPTRQAVSIIGVAGTPYTAMEG